MVKNFNESSTAVFVSLSDLKEFGMELIRQTKTELEKAITDQKSERYLTAQSVSKMLDVNLTSLWRWNKRKYLVPCKVGNKNMYKMSEINKLLKTN